MACCASGCWHSWDTLFNNNNLSLTIIMTRVIVSGIMLTYPGFSSFALSLFKTKLWEVRPNARETTPKRLFRKFALAHGFFANDVHFCLLQPYCSSKLSYTFLPSCLICLGCPGAWAEGRCLVFWLISQHLFWLRICRHDWDPDQRRREERRRWQMSYFLVLIFTNIHVKI